MPHILRRGLFMAAVAALLLAIGGQPCFGQYRIITSAGACPPPTLTDTQTVLVTDLNRGVVTAQPCSV